MSDIAGATRALRAERVSLAFGALQVLFGVDVEFPPGRITGLIGPNGAGKSSLFNCLTGLYRPQTGKITFGGARLDGLPPAARAGHGLARSFQHVALCSEMTVAENVMFGLTRHGKAGWASAFLPLPAGARERADARARAIAALELLAIAALADKRVGELPPGPLRLVELARAIVGEPRVLLLDEPAAGLNSLETRDLLAALRRIARPELVMVVVEHDMDLIMQLCDSIYVLNFGKVIALGTPDEIRRDPEVARVYLGADDA
ncbi:MAG: ABC transporter ATP-binding protein [Alphaproteobacteria bacterium]|nr:ABC transporter ATP-binding protein [Alphaproteobacteria bacterium]